MLTYDLMETFNFFEPIFSNDWIGLQLLLRFKDEEIGTSG